MFNLFSTFLIKILLVIESAKDFENKESLEKLETKNNENNQIANSNLNHGKAENNNNMEKYFSVEPLIFHQVFILKNIFG